MMMMKGVVVMKTGCLFAEISFTYVVKNYFDNGHISRDCLRTQQLQGGWDTQRKRLSGCFFIKCWMLVVSIDSIFGDVQMVSCWSLIEILSG